MGKKLTTRMYNFSRTISKTASKLNDLERLAKGDISGLVKKKARKETYKKTNQLSRGISKALKFDK